MQGLLNASNITNSTFYPWIGGISYIEQLVLHCLLVFVCLPPFVVHVINSVAIWYSTAIPTSIKTTLINIFFSNIVYSIAVIVWVLGFLIRITNNIKDTSLTCQYMLFLCIFGSLLIFSSIFVFGVTVPLQIKYCSDKRQLVKVIIIVCILFWGLCALCSLGAFLPSGVSITEDGLRCTVVLVVHTPAFYYFHIANIVWLFLGVSCANATIILSCIVQRYRSWRTSETIPPNVISSLLVLFFYLVLQSITNIFTMTIFPTVLNTLNRIPLNFDLTYYSTLFLSTVLLWPTPVVVLCVFREPRDVLSKLVCCCCPNKVRIAPECIPEEQDVEGKITTHSNSESGEAAYNSSVLETIMTLKEALEKLSPEERVLLSRV